MWQIIDDNSCLYSGTQEEMQSIWDILTRDVNDYACEYKISFKEAMKKFAEYRDIYWDGDLKLIEVHEIFR